jgi:hypothetical protein
MTNRDPWWDEHKERFIEHIKNQSVNLHNFCKKYPVRYDETLDVLELLIKLIKEEPKLIGIFCHTYTNPSLWTEIWKENN